MQINLTGFLGGSKARLFISELWKFLTSAQTSPDGIAAELVEMKKLEMLQRQVDDDRLREIRKREEETHRSEVKPDIVILDGKSNGRIRDRRRSPAPKKATGLPDRSKETKRPRTPSPPPRSKASSKRTKKPAKRTRSSSSSRSSSSYSSSTSSDSESDSKRKHRKSTSSSPAS